MHDVDGKVAFITGGSSGIGLGVAKAFHRAGMKVAIGYRTKAHLDEAMGALDGADGSVHGIRVDVTDRRGMERAARETVRLFGKVHVLVNNAGVFTVVPLRRITYDDWDWVMGVNLGGVFNGLHAFIPHICAHKDGGHIVATSSVWGLLAGPALGAYCASKFAVVGLMETLRAELAKTKIGVSVYCPGFVSSNVLDSARNRPRRFARSGCDPSLMARFQKEAIRSNDDRQLNMDPIEAGELVLAGIRRNDLYILTHPEWENRIRQRHQLIIASMPKHLKAPLKRTRVVHAAFPNPTYAEKSIRRTK